MANGVTRPRRAWSAAMAVTLVVAACQGATTSPSATTSATEASTAPAASTGASPSAAQPYAGQTITLETYATVPEFDFYATLMPQFQQQTGITVNYVQQPVAAQDQKIPLQLTAKDDSLDVFFTGSENIGHYVGISGVEPLDSYIADTAQTPATWDFKDIAPAVESACQSGGKTYCIASHTGGGLLYYNKKMFADAGITAPPATPDELLADAIKLTTADHAGFCVRADKSQTLYDGFQMWNWFVPWDNPVTGTYFDQKWNFLIGTEPQASQFGTFYRNLLTKAAPKGIATYLVTNCLSDFQQGRVAMWQDDSGSIPDVLDPNKSKVASDAAFWEVPCQPVNPDHCALVQPFGTWMNAASKHKEAAWQLIQFLTSKETQAAAAKAKALLTPSRNSVLKDPTVIAAFPPTFPDALTYILAHPDVALLPFIPEGVAIIPPISDGLSALITTNDPVASIMAQMKAGEASIMTKAGYPKPFPSFTAP
ncbi:MAG TPA: extracellular solute-binding protein [Candidatus Bathyarchaeia archaeon]|nr:extracellular solute-binding protein [Candidatus Bathyarchaeia archaeon]